MDKVEQFDSTEEAKLSTQSNGLPGYEDNTPKEVQKSSVDEKALLRKLDLRLILILFLCQLSSYLDKANLTYGKQFGILKDLNMTADNLAWCFSIYSIGFLICEIPSNLILKKATAPRWFARIMVTWGAVTLGSAFVTNFAGMAACRFLLGVFEAGMFPGIIYYLSFWYKRNEQAFRIAYVSSSNPFSGVISGLLATGMVGIHKKGGFTGWQWLFIIEGIPTILLGAATWFILPSTPKDAKFLTEEEREFMVNRLLDDCTDSQTTKFHWDQIKEALLDYKVWLFSLMNFTVSIPTSAILIYFPSIVGEMGFDKTTAFILTIPPALVGVILHLWLAFRSDSKGERCFHFCLPFFFIIIGYLINIFSDNRIAKYIGMFIVQTLKSTCLPVFASWYSNNMVGSTKMGFVSAMTVTAAGLGNFVGPHLYQEYDSPRYIRGHVAGIGIMVLTIGLAVLLRFLLKRENDKLDALAQQKQSITRSDGLDSSNFRYTL